MGEQKARIKAFGKKAQPVAEHTKTYLFALRALINSISSDKLQVIIPNLAVIGNAAVWPCQDGAVVLISSDKTAQISVDIKTPLSVNVNDFLETGQACAFFDKTGRRSKVKFGLKIDDVSKAMIHFGDMKIKGPKGKIIRPKYSRASIFGWEAKLPEPDVLALEDFKSAFTIQNVAGHEVEDLPTQEIFGLTKAKADGLFSEYNQLINSAEREEDVQSFLSQHPEFLYPDYIKCFPKFKLGEDFVTDYVLLIQGHQGLEYVFVEIERPNKEIFVKSGQFSAPFTQAKDQLLGWDSWLTKHHAYASTKLPDLHKPKFHLIIGRGNELDKVQKEKIQNEFSGTNRIFSTYDDLGNRFKTIVDRLLRNT